MTERALRPANLAAAAVVLGGILIVAAPRHAPTIVRLTLGAIAAGAGLHVLAFHVPPTGWISPFRWMSPFGGRSSTRGRGREAEPTDAIRASFAGRRQRIPGGPPLPPDTLRLVRGTAAATLAVDLNDPVRLATLRASLPPEVGAVLAAEPLDSAYWFRTVAPDERQVAEAVHRVLDELDRLTASHATIDSRTERPR